MASTKLTDVSAALSLLYRRSMTSQINSVAVLPFLLPVLPGEGKALYWTVEFSGASNASASAEGVARDSSDADDEAEVPATLSWAQYDKTASVTGLAQAAAGSNYNPQSIGAEGQDLLLGRVRRQHRRVALGMAADLYAGDPTASPVELAGAATAIDSSGTFAGINPGTYSEWVSTENSIALASISFQQIRENLYTPIYDACGESPDFVTCPSNIYDAVKALFSDYEKFVRDEITLYRGGGPDGMEARTVKLAAGVDCFMVEGIPWIRDRHATANTAYAWNSNYVAIRQLDPLASILNQGAQGVLDFFRRITDNPNLVLPREDLEGMAAAYPGISTHIRVLGDRGDSTEAMILAYAQVEWLRRNAFGKLVFT